MRYRELHAVSNVVRILACGRDDARVRTSSIVLIAFLNADAFYPRVCANDIDRHPPGMAHAPTYDGRRNIFDCTLQCEP
eukprot:8970089-Pyramimonas_sp.AAC.1